MSPRFASFVSTIFHPIPMTVLVGLIGIFASPMGPNQRFFWLVLVAVMGVLVGFIVVWFIRQGYVIDATLAHGGDVHRDRLGVLWITNALLTIAVITAWMVGPTEPLWSVLVGMTTLLVLATLITNVYKVSLHMVGITSLAIVLLTQYRVVALPTLLLIGLVAWSRRVLHRHTPSQLLLGTGLAVVVLLTTFWLTGER